MLLAGIRRRHRFTDVASTMPQQWRDFMALGPISGRKEGRAFGAVCGTDAEGFEYLAGVEVESFEDLPRDLGRMRVPAQEYAVFTHEDHVSTIGETWEYIWNGWLPASEWVAADTPDFELYGPGFDPATGLGGVEIWFPIERKGGSGRTD